MSRVHSFITLIGLAILASATNGFAQDQRVVLTKPPVACTPLDTDASGVPSGKITEAQAPTLITTVLGAGPVAKQSYILNVVKYGERGMAVDTANWYVYDTSWVHRSGAYRLVDWGVHKHFEETRLYNGKTVSVLYMHEFRGIGRAAALREAFIFQLATLLAATPTPTLDAVATLRDDTRKDYLRHFPKRRDETMPVYTARIDQQIATDLDALQQAWHERLNAGDALPAFTMDETTEVRKYFEKARQDAERGVDEILTQGAVPHLKIVDAATSQELVRISESVLGPRAMGPLANLSYRVDITKKVPAPFQDALGAARIIVPNSDLAAMQVSVTWVALCGGGRFDVKPKPSDMVVTALVPADDKDKELTKQTFDNEQKYVWDISFALPVKSYRELTYSFDKGEVTAKKVQKGNLFATVNLTYPPFDTKKAQLRFLPVFLYGMPITGNPLKHHLVAVAFGLTRVQPWVGFTFDRNDVAPKVEGDVANFTGHQWDHSFTFGINISVGAVTTLLKAGK